MSSSRFARPVALMLLVALLAGSAAGCAWRRTEKCYLPMSRYYAMRGLFQETGSMQRVEQAMKEEKWATCERNQFRYMLAKDLGLEELQLELLDAPAEPAG